MDSLTKSDCTVNDGSTIKLIKEVSAADVRIKKIVDTDTLRKRKLRFAENALPECNAPVSKNDAEDALKKRQLRFSKDDVKKPNDDILNTLKKRKERFGEITSTLLKSIEEKEKVLKRKARFGQVIDGMNSDDKNTKVLKMEQKLDNISCEISSNKTDGKKVLKKITFNKSDFLLSRKKIQLNGS